MIPIAHAGHWVASLLYLAPLLLVIGALGWQSLRDRRRGVPPPDEPGDPPPAA